MEGWTEGIAIEFGEHQMTKTQVVATSGAIETLRRIGVVHGECCNISSRIDQHLGDLDEVTFRAVAYAQTT